MDGSKCRHVHRDRHLYYPACRGGDSGSDPGHLAYGWRTLKLTNDPQPSTEVFIRSLDSVVGLYPCVPDYDSGIVTVFQESSGRWFWRVMREGAD